MVLLAFYLVLCAVVHAVPVRLPPNRTVVVNAVGGALTFTSGGYTHEFNPNQAPLDYNVPTGAGRWRLKLQFVENYVGNYAKGRRIFSVFLNEDIVARNIDVFDKAGGALKSYFVEATATAVNGLVALRITPSVENAFITSIEVLQLQEKEDDDDASTAPVIGITFSRVKQDYPLNVFEAGGTVLPSGGNMYLTVFGGFFGFPGITAKVYRRLFGSASAKWERLVDLPAPVSTHMAQAVDGATFCAVGGFVDAYPGESGVHAFCYDSETGLYTRLPYLPAPRAGGGLAFIKSGTTRTLLYSGGTYRDANFTHTDFGTTWSLRLDVAGAMWAPAGNMPDGRNHMAAVNACGRVLFIGGQHKIDEQSGNSRTVSEWLPDENKWSTNPPAQLPLPLGHISASVMPYKCGVLVVGGITNGKKHSDKVLYWHPSINRWTEVGTYPNRVATPVCGIVGDAMMCATGGEWTIQKHVYYATINNM